MISPKARQQAMRMLGCFLVFCYLGSVLAKLPPGDDYIVEKISERLQLEPNEKFHENFQGIGIPTSLQPFIAFNTFNLDQISLWKEDAPSNCCDYQSFYQGALVTVDVPAPFVDCWQHAFDQYENWNITAKYKSIPHGWDGSMDRYDWEYKYWLGELNDTSMSFSWSYKRDDDSGCVVVEESFFVETLVRIDVWPDGGWFNAGFFTTFSRVPLSSPGPCKNSKSIQTCYLDEDTGSMNTLPTAIVVVTGVERNSTWTRCGESIPYETANATSPYATPMIIGRVVQKMPWQVECLESSTLPSIDVAEQKENKINIQEYDE